MSLHQVDAVYLRYGESSARFDMTMWLRKFKVSERNETQRGTFWYPIDEDELHVTSRSKSVNWDYLV